MNVGMLKNERKFSVRLNEDYHTEYIAMLEALKKSHMYKSEAEIIREGIRSLYNECFGKVEMEKERGQLIGAVFETMKAEIKEMLMLHDIKLLGQLAGVSGAFSYPLADREELSEIGSREKDSATAGRRKESGKEDGNLKRVDELPDVSIDFLRSMGI